MSLALIALASPAHAQPTTVGFDQISAGDTAWMLTSTALVLLMTIPGLALFYAGMVRKKNVLATALQSFCICALITVLWVFVGYSLAFTPGTPWIGSLDRLLLEGMVYLKETSQLTVSHIAPTIPESVFVMFQLTFAIITPALITGAFAERMRFGSLMVFMALWSLLVYVPVAHWVWEPGGWLASLGALDFAGGTVVHINAGIAGLVAAIFLGKRTGYGKVQMAPHSLVMTTIGASLLWFGWFGFNAGSNLEANGYAVLAFGNTLFATAVAALTWFFAEWIIKGKPSLLCILSGAIAGLVAITPACGFVGIEGALWVGLAGGLGCFLAVSFLKKALGYDDALDAFGVHAVGGIIGAVLTGVFVDPAKGGAGYVTDGWVGPAFGYDSAQIMIQVKAVLIAIVWSAVVSAIALLICKFTVGLRVTEEQESEGLDIAEHGEQSYHD